MTGSKIRNPSLGRVLTLPRIQFGANATTAKLLMVCIAKSQMNMINVEAYTKEHPTDYRLKRI